MARPQTKSSKPKPSKPKSRRKSGSAARKKKRRENRQIVRPGQMFFAGACLVYAFAIQ